MYKYRKDEDISYTLGTTLTFELLNRKPEAATAIYISPKQNRDETYAKLVSLARKNHVSVIENNEKIFRELSDKDNTMVIGAFKKYKGELVKGANHVCLVNPSNMGNLGTIVRCLAGFNILNLVIITPAADIFDPKTIRSSMGAIFSVNFKLYSSYQEYQKEFPENHAYPFMLQAKYALKDAKKVEPFTLVFGNEATGLDRSFLEIGEPVIVPISPLVDSLNLDNAVAIGVYEVTKRA